MSRHRICLVIPSLQAGGMERVMSELAEYFFKKNNDEVHLILYGINREEFYRVSPGIFIHRPDFKFNNSLRWIFAIKTMFFIRHSVKRINPIAILSFGEIWNSFVLLALTNLRYPVYVSDRCQPDKSLGRFHNFLRKALYPYAKGIIVQTSTAERIYRHQYGLNKTLVIGNPIRQTKKIINIKKEKIVLMVGRLIETKHQDKLIEIFLSINEPEWKLVLVGYDHLKQKMSQKLVKIIADADATEKVQLAGKQTEVESYYLKSSIFAFTSSSEGFPNALGEAMASGLPVVAFDCIAGPSELIQDGLNGFLVPLFDYCQFKSRLHQLMDDESLRITMGQRASRSMEKYTIDLIGKQYRKILEVL